VDRWVGHWESKTTDKPTDASAEANETAGLRNVAKILDGRLLQSHWTSQDGDEENLSLLAYDHESSAYRQWTFSSSGAAMEFAGQWDDETNTLALELVPPAPGATGTSILRFVDADNIESRLTVKDETGTVICDVEETLGRKNASGASDIPSSQEAITPEQSPEFEVLQRFIGSWQWQVTSRPAGASEKTTMALATECEWALRGRMIKHEYDWSPANANGLGLVTYDAEKQAYRDWYFGSSGPLPQGENWGKWDESTQTLSWKGTVPNGTSTTQVCRFTDNDTIEWRLLSEDRSGEDLLEMEGTAKRKER
jgi:hypothetical protein